MDGYANFYVATASVTGALIGLLFVAISVSQERLTGPEASPLHRVRASAALTTFTNALVLALFALIPDLPLGPVVVVVGLAGIGVSVAALLLLRREAGVPLVAAAFVAFSGLLLRRHRGRRGRDARDAAFLFGLLSALAVQVVAGVLLARDPDSAAGAQLLATVIIVCCFVGVERSWELIGGPSVGFTREVRALWRDAERPPAAADDGDRRRDRDSPPAVRRGASDRATRSRRR